MIDNIKANIQAAEIKKAITNDVKDFVKKNGAAELVKNSRFIAATFKLILSLNDCDSALIDYAEDVFNDVVEQYKNGGYKF